MSGPVSLQPGPALSGKTGSDASLRDAARQLEGVFLSMMFQEMAKGTGEENALFPKSPGQDMYEQWFRGEIATQFSRSGGLGLGDTIAGQMGARRAPSASLGEAAAPRASGAPEVPSSMTVADRVRTRAAAPSPSRGNDRRRPPPVSGPVTSGFGTRIHPVTGERDEHTGVDIGVASGTPVRVPYGGRVTRVAEDPHLGLHVVVEHRGGYSSLYAHLSRTELRVGQRIDAASPVGESGASGRTTGPHLHFALYRHGRPVDPGRWVRLRSEF